MQCGDSKMDIDGRLTTHDGLILPADLLCACFKQLDFISRVRCQVVCKNWNSLLSRPSDTLWGEVTIFGDTVSKLAQSPSAPLAPSTTSEEVAPVTR